MENDLVQSIEDALIGQENVHGQYRSKWGRVWRGGDVLVFIDKEYLIPTNRVTPEELDEIKGFIEKRPGVPGTDMPPLKLKLSESLTEGKKVTTYTVEAFFRLDIVEHDNVQIRDQRDDRFYEGCNFAVHLISGDGMHENNVELFEYDVTHLSLPPQQEVIEKTLISELKLAEPRAQFNLKTIQQVSSKLAVMMDASKRFLPKNPIQENSVRSRISSFLRESQSKV